MIHILVVEDDEKMNQIICTYLARNNYQAAGCRNPVEAYDLMSTEVFDLIISDIMMCYDVVYGYRGCCFFKT